MAIYLERLRFFNSIEIITGLHDFTEKRHFHHTDNFNLAFFQIYNAVAMSLNKTLLGFDRRSFPNETSVYLGLTQSGDTQYSLENIRKLYGGFINIWRFFDLSYNFIYCSPRSKTSESVFLVSLLLKCADIYTWISLILSAFAVAVFNNLLNRQGCYENLFTAWTTFLRQDASKHNFHKVSAIVASVWLLMGDMFMMWFDGYLTSSLTVPVSDKQMESLVNLKDGKYSLLFESQAMANLFHRNILSGFDSVRNKKRKTQTELKAFRELIKSQIITNSEDVLVKTLLRGFGKYACLEPHQLGSRIGGQLQYYLNERQTDGELMNTRCYVSKSLIPASTNYLLVGGTEYDLVWNKLLLLIESGIYSWWMNEFLGIMSSNRVQGRNMIGIGGRIKEWTVIVPPLPLGDRIRNVFCGLATGTIISTTVFLLEYNSERLGIA